MGMPGRISAKGSALKYAARERHPRAPVGRVDCTDDFPMRRRVSAECRDDAADRVAARTNCRSESVWIHELSDCVALHEVCACNHVVWRSRGYPWWDVA